MKGKQDMRKIVQKARLENSADMAAVLAGKIKPGKVRAADVELLVDTGAAMLCLTPSVIENLGLHKLHERDVITGNGIVKRYVYEPVRIRIRDREADLNVMEVPAGTPPLLGYLPLEALDLYPNPKKRVLEGNPQYDGKMVTDLL
ncbi:MAG TPA: retroviral-like aspartic protease family protein [Steroidobacteraceae bacterium]|nr:retroviral-like aspartic protease family protein [Steroidobacteraceae bacterium]